MGNAEARNSLSNLPRHVAIIMDGNGRWAQIRNLARTKGHLEGAKVFKDTVIYCNNIGLEYLTVYAFSTENWARPKLEVNFLINLFKDQLTEALENFKNENIKVKFLGDTSAFPTTLVNLINKVEKTSKKNTGLNLNIALNYGGKAEILNAVKNIVKDVLKGKITKDEISLNTIENNLYTKGQPEPDIIIRTGGNIRVSNFLLWQGSYSEYFFTRTLWPDFNKKELENIFNEYSLRTRRFGKV